MEKDKIIANLVLPPDDNLSVMQQIALLSKDRQKEIVDDIIAKRFPDKGYQGIKYAWDLWGRPSQLSVLDETLPWKRYVYCAGRSFGKTRTASEYMRHLAETKPGVRIGFIGRTDGDTLGIMVKGQSGLLSICPPWNMPQLRPSYKEVIWKNGSMVQYFSSTEPDKLRGYQFDYLAEDEICSWLFPTETFDNASMCLRLGTDPRTIITTTPRNQEFFKNILSDKNTYTYRGSTFENAGNVAQGYLDDMTDRYAGTTLGRQELEAEILSDIKDALFKRQTIEKNRVPIGKLNQLPNFIYTVVAVDPAMSTNKTSAETGICVAAYGEDDHFYILELEGDKLEPLQWARRVLEFYDDYNAGWIVMETNQGGDLVINNIRQIRPHASIYGVSATRGKYLRAEPVSSLYERGKVHHAKVFARGEDQLANFHPVNNPNGLKDCCLDGNTMIHTDLGLKKIKDINTNDLALTRKGYKKILAKKLTHENANVLKLKLSNGKEIVATPYHKLYVENKGFVEIENIKKGDILLSCLENTTIQKNFQNLMEILISDTQFQTVQHLDGIFGEMIMENLSLCTETFGNTFMEKFLKDMLFITKTEIHTTTQLRIWSAFQKQSIEMNTSKKHLNALEPQNIWNYLNQLETLQKNGTNLTKGENGTESTPRKQGLQKENTKNTHVNNVKTSLNQKAVRDQYSFVQENVLLNSTTLKEDTAKSLNVRFAELNFLETNTLKSLNIKPVPVSVLEKQGAGTANVYNLAVADEHEYYANGVLSKNCDALVYAISCLMEKSSVGYSSMPAIGGIRSKLINYKLR
jgi:phage terminase large subunit-like protein